MMFQILCPLRPFLLKALGFLLIMPSFAFGLTMDWTGFARGEFYFQDNKDMYGEYHLVLQPELQILDRLSVKSSLELFPSYGADIFLSTSSIENRRVGVVFFHRPDLGKDLKTSSLLLHMSQIYINYESEFFHLRVGKAPYHFGLGVTYNAGRSPFHYWFSTFNQMVVRFEHTRFYVQPALIQDQSKLFALVQAGMEGQHWKLEGFYRYDPSANDFSEIYGEYFKKNWDVKVSASYLFTDQLSLGIATELGLKIKAPIPSRIQIKSGLAKRFSFHHNYVASFLLWNRFISRDDSNSQKVLLQEEQISNLFYLNPSWKFSFLSKKLNFTPSFTFGRFLFEKKDNYEFDINTNYFLSKNFSISLIGGLIYRDKKINYGLLGQAAVTF